MRTHKNTAILLVTLSALFWGTNFNVGKMIIQHLSPLTAAAVRFTLASAIIIPIMGYAETNTLQAVKRNFFTYIVLGVIGVAGMNGLFFWGLKYTTPINGALIMATNPLVTVLLARLLFNVPIHKNQKLGMLFSLFGVLVVITNGSLDMMLHLKMSIGDAIIMGGNVCWAFYGVYGKRSLRESTPLMTTTTSMTIGAMVLMVLAYHAGQLNQLADQPWQVYAAIIYMALFGSVMAYLFWNIGIARLGAGTTSIFFNLVPVFTVLVSLAAGHPVTLMQVAGGALVVIGVVLATRPAKMTESLIKGIV